MTESEWLTSTNPLVMVAFVQNATRSFRTRWLGWLTRKRFAFSERKMRLLGCAIAGRVAQFVPEGPVLEFLNVVEEWAEGNFTCPIERAFADDSHFADREQ